MSETPTERAMLAAIREHVSTTGGDAGGAIVVLVSEQRNKRFGNRYVMAWQRAGGEFCHHGGALFVDGLACSMLRAAEYLPAEIVWYEHEVTRPSPR